MEFKYSTQGSHPIIIGPHILGTTESTSSQLAYPVPSTRDDKLNGFGRSILSAHLKTFEVPCRATEIYGQAKPMAWHAQI